jgi:hypothetical protein
VKKSKYGDFDSKDDVLDHIADLWGLYEGEGLEEAYAAFMRLPDDQRTVEKLDRICKGIAPADIDFYDDDSEFIPRI